MPLQATMEKRTDTLGYHRVMAVAVFGADSPAVKFLDQKIKDSPNGEHERVIVHETQVVYLLSQLHLGKVKLEDMKL